MARYISRKNPISVASLKRRPLGSVIVHHWSHGEDRFARCVGGWRRELEDSIWIWPPVIVSSAYVANECNKAIGCKESWARIY